MISNRHVAFVVQGVITKAAQIAREIGQRSLNRETRETSQFIASEIEHLNDPLHAWEEREARRWAGRDGARERQAEGSGVNDIGQVVHE